MKNKFITLTQIIVLGVTTIVGITGDAALAVAGLAIYHTGTLIKEKETI